MTQTNRLSSGGRVNRAKTVKFTFDGKTYEGFEGDTLSSALLANNVHLVGRSFKYHRPRGVLTAGSEEPNAIVQLGEGNRTEPNCRTPMVELYDGLKATAQNCWPSVNFDIGGINNKLSRFFPAGFYYKTFMWPKGMWEKYEHVIRASAGMGNAPSENDPDTYATKHVHCDVLVAGGGVSGLAAALTAGRTGARVILAEEHAEFGGQLLSDADATIDGKPAMEWVEATLAELRSMEEVTILPRTTVTAYYDHNFLSALERVTDHLGHGNGGDLPRQRFWQIRAKQVVLAQGAIERPMLFGDNDRPGVMLASAVRTYINRFGVLPGKNVVVFTNNDSAYATAIDAHKAGAKVTIVDIRENPAGAWVEKAKALSIQIHTNMAVIGTTGYRKVTGVDIMPLTADGKGVTGQSQRIDADIVAMSSGWNPMISLFSQGRGKLRYDEKLTSFVPDHCQWANISVGAGNGEFTLEGCLSQGLAAGSKAAQDAGFGDGVVPPTPAAPEDAQGDMRILWYIPSDRPLGRGRKHFHEFQNDSTVADIHLAEREGFVSVEHLKRYTTTGMGTDQGKTSNVNAIAIMSQIRDVKIPMVGTTTFRPPYTPLTFGAAAGHAVGELFLQKRKTAMHPTHEEMGAVYEDVGDWKRPRYFPKDGEDMHAAVQRECKQVRETVGMMDASTLGKIDIQGPDAAEFLNMIYTNAWLKLGVGKARYGLMCNEHGMVFDDGVTTRLGENHFHMTTTTGGAGRVANWLEEWLQTEWPEMKVYCTSVTEQWAVSSLNGPKSRELLAELTDIDLDPENFKFMEMREGHVAGVPARVYRISFTGEIAYEINVPHRYGKHVWDALIEAGKKYDLVLYGTESMHVLRAEKGFIIAGQDTDGSVTPMDLDMSWIVGKNKPDFLGRRSFARSDTSRPGRKQLVGILTEDPNVVLPEGAHVVETVKDRPPMDMLGHISSSYMSPNVGRSIAMGLIKDGFNRKGQTLSVPLMDGSVHKVTITDPIFFDKEGERTRG
ncbi:sarcosine oxidase subunit alpha [Aestuariispira insulae]|uniref:Heterotetrameric sarcosine oxidase alpha subunit n=1 Tax=Aestuariispira insulae TaxID=1461337 RepID=A0A3D9HH13_9PROT|nr:sarcosine oxidase subunit alpha [Aestuariispira insulae]RED48541.1 heterotetrameric sarcosine oxidase alpha subunit [Aestuariispira insulae]